MTFKLDLSSYKINVIELAPNHPVVEVYYVQTSFSRYIELANAKKGGSTLQLQI